MLALLIPVHCASAGRPAVCLLQERHGSGCRAGDGHRQRIPGGQQLVTWDYTVLTPLRTL
jgi:hypothetical protein